MAVSLTRVADSGHGGKPNRTEPCFGLSTFDDVGAHTQVLQLECINLEWSGTDAGSTEGKPPRIFMHVRILAVSGKNCMV